MADVGGAARPIGNAHGRPDWRIVAPGVLTGDAFELFEETRAALGGPPAHVHRERDEAFFVLEGRYRFTRDHDELELEPGGFIFVPRGTRHQFRTLEAPSRTLIIVAPAGLETFFREMGARLAEGANALEAMTALAATHDTHPVD
jgi:mannose-6-phosphate isomerase-like protein (cupin superfamily)